MALKRYGLFVAFPPRVELRREGLGRYVATFVRNAAEIPDTHMVIACPSWSRESLRDLLKSMDIPGHAYTLVGPAKPSLLLRGFDWLRPPRGQRHQRQDLTRGRLVDFPHSIAVHSDRAAQKLAGARNPFSFALGFVAVTLLGSVSAIVFVSGRIRRFIAKVARALQTPSFTKHVVRRLPTPVRRLFHSFRRSPISSVQPSQPSARRRFMRRLFEAMERREVELMLAEIQRAGTVVGWYCPTAFWPAFNRIQGARLVCLPDAVSAEFPAEFGAMLPSQATILDAIMETMAGVQHVVTYSQHIRDAVASGVFGIDPSRVTVIRHAPNDLSSHVAVNGFDNSDSASRSLAEGLIQSALRKASGRTSLVPRRSLEFTFLFYASQFRPSKNMVSLLRAYEFLLRQKFIGHKLILTGHGDDPAVSAFMKEHQLEREVLCLHGVSDAELAALYSGAVLAVNPSLSEGGMPFTFTEALSVGTPVVMGDIAVTSEVLTDPALRETMLFDPYDWRSIADKIQWALENRSLLLEKQRRYYQDVLAKRTWADVVKEHLDLLDDLARQRQ